VSALSWGFVVVGGIALCVLVALSLAFHLDFVLIGLFVVAALAATYIAGRIDKRKERGPWAKGNGDS
jgi:membrane protein implicated in regulation of membrane protease activity